MVSLEVPVDNMESAMIAIRNGANRLELCSTLSKGGLTPSVGFLKMVKREVNLFSKIPIYCMLRPHDCDNFVYSDMDMEVILSDMEILQENGADGFVFGSLTGEVSGDINREQCKRIIEHANGLPVTFHRAFDLTIEERMHQTMADLITLGFKRVLTSGFQKTVESGIDALTKLIELYHNHIIIVPGGGISAHNADRIIRRTKCIEFHSSGRLSEHSESISKFGSSYCANDDIVRKLVNIAKVFEMKS